MQNKALFVGFNDGFLQQVLDNLNTDSEISRVVYSPSASIDRNQNVIFSQFLIRENSIKEHYSEYLQNSIDIEVLEELAECRVFFNRTLDRVFLSPLSVRQSDMYFYTLIEFWISFLSKSSNLRAVFFDATPHFPWDVCLFFVAKYLNIKTYILRRTLINNCVVFDEDFRNNKQNIVKYNGSFTGGFEVDELLTLYKEDSYWLNWSKSFLPNDDVKQAKKNVVLFFVERMLKLIKIIIDELLNCNKTYFRLSRLNYISLIVKRLLQQRKLSQLWEVNSRNIPRGVPLAYFPLHFQPERTTDPESGYFSQQVLAIKLLLKILPKEWRVVVKEHPRQNRHEYPNLRRLNYRDSLEYQELFKLSRVIPVSMFVSSSELLANCQLSASCTGSVLWESMLQGKPSISFGTHWHSDCKSSPFIYDIAVNPSILTDLLSKDKGDVLKDVDDFIKSNSNNFINASNSEQFARQSNQDVNLLISNLSEAIDYILKVES